MSAPPRRREIPPLRDGVPQKRDEMQIHRHSGRNDTALAHGKLVMAFASIYVPNFWLQAMVRAEPALRGCALALVDGTPPLWNVVAANDAALHAGIKLEMAKAQAEQFAGVEIRPRSRTQEESAHTALLDLGWSISPRIEDTAPDTVTLDLIGLHSLFGSEEEIARQLTQRAIGLGLNIHVAAAANPDAAIH